MAFNNSLTSSNESQWQLACQVPLTNMLSTYTPYIPQYMTLLLGIASDFEMDPMYLNLQQAAVASASIPNSVSSVTQLNGLSQESKLASYINNGQQLQLTQQNHNQTLAKSLVSLNLDVTPRKTSLSNLGAEYVPGSSSNLAHSASTPSFHSSATSTSRSFAPLARQTPNTSSPQRGHTPPPLGSPGRGSSAPPTGHQNSPGNETQNTSSVSTYQDVSGTTYFFSGNELNFSSVSHQSNAQPNLVLPPYHVLPSTPAHIHHLRTPTHAPHFFIGDDLRHDILERQAITLSHVDPEQYPDLPQEVDMYHELCPLEPPTTVNKSNIFGYCTSVYKATNMKTGLHYCLYRIHGFRLNNVKVTQFVDMWKKLQHSSIIQLREVFTTKAFSDHSIVFVYDYHAGAETLAARYFANNSLANVWQGRESSSLTSSSNSFSLSSSSSNQNDAGRSSLQKIQLLPEATLWNYIIQLTGAVRQVHTQGLACRTLDPGKILLTDNKSRIRLNCCGILDVLNFDANAANPLGNISQSQKEDLVNLGHLMVALAFNTVLALQRDNLGQAIEVINRTYSRDLSMLVVCLITQQRVNTVNDIMPMIGARFYTALESATQRGDLYEAELAKEIHNGRLFRLLAKLCTIVDRPHLSLDTGWSDTGDRYMLKLFRDYLFHQHLEDGRPWLDLGHVVSALNKLDSASPDKICLMSHDEQNILVTSYQELKSCFERSFDELLTASTQKTALS